MESNRLLFVAHVNNQLLVDEIGFFPHSPCFFCLSSEFWRKKPGLLTVYIRAYLQDICKSVRRSKPQTK